MSEVLVVGAGPVGLTMAAELARHGVPSRIVERRPDRSPYCRAIGITPRTLEVWNDMGVARDMIEAGLWIDTMRVIGPGFERDIDRALGDLPYETLGLPQYETERLLERHLDGLGTGVDRNITVSAIAPAGDGAAVTLVRGDGREEKASYRFVIGCDGAHSMVRRAAGIAFDGEAMPFDFMLGDVHIDWDLPRGATMRAVFPRKDAAPDMLIAIPLPEHGRYRLSMLAPQGGPEQAEADGVAHGIQSERPAPGIEQLQAVADALLPRPARLSDMRWSSIFRISMRLAAKYRVGPLFVAGDAAHIHPPTGGQGMNTGIQDAYNLAWKMALVLRGAAGDALLDSYDAERRRVGEEVIERTLQASMRLGSERGGRSEALADTQLLVNYRGSAIVSDDGGEGEPRGGDLAPDCGGLRRRGVGFPFQMLDLLRGTAHVLLVPVKSPEAEIAALEMLAADLRGAFGPAHGDWLRVVAIAPKGAVLPQPYRVSVVEDAEGTFAATYGSASCMVRPDKYIGWRGQVPDAGGLKACLCKTFTSRSG